MVRSEVVFFVTNMMVWSCFLLSTQHLVSQSWSSSIVTKVGIVGHSAGSIAIARVVVNSRDSSVVVGGDWSLNSSIVVGRNGGSVVGDEGGSDGDGLLVDVGLSWDLDIDVGLCWDLHMHVGLGSYLLVDVLLGWDLLVEGYN